MNKFFTVALCVVLGTSVSAQSTIQVTDFEETVYGEPSASLLKSNALVQNTGSETIEVMVRFEELSQVPSGAGRYFCWFVCYDSSIPDGYETPPVHSIAIEPDSVADNFFADYLPNGTVGVATFRFTFYEKDNESNSTSIDITFDTQNVGIEDVFASDDSGISESYPNPAVDEAKINYSVKAGSENADLVIYNMLGSKVKVLALNEEQGTLRVDVSSLPAGLYFYSMVVDDQEVATKKMLVTK